VQNLSRAVRRDARLDVLEPGHETRIADELRRDRVIGMPPLEPVRDDYRGPRMAD